MNARRLLVLSVCGNLLLISALLALHRKPAPLPKRIVLAQPPGPAALAPAQVALVQDEPSPLQPQFHWSEVESEDFQVFVANLRAIGCPPKSIRAIISGELHELFEARVLAMVDPLQSEFWEIISQNAKMEKLIDEKGSELTELENGQRDALDRLLGRREVALMNLDESSLGHLAGTFRSLDFLPEWKVQRWLAVEREYAMRQEDLRGSPELPDFATRSKALEDEKQQALQSLMSPEEKEEWRLRNSQAAALRFGLPGLAVSEEEVEALVRIEDRYKAPASGASGQQGDRGGLAQQKQAELLALLGSEKLAQYDRARDDRFGEFYALVEQFAIPEHTATELFEIRKAAEETAGELRRDNQLPGDARLLALEALRAEAEAAVQGAMGSQVFSVYQKNCSWLSALESAK